jgi:hypothetical protein
LEQVLSHSRQLGRRGRRVQRLCFHPFQVNIRKGFLPVWLLQKCIQALAMLWQVVLKHFKSPIASVNIRQPQKACHRFLGFVMTRSCKRVGVQACKCAKVRSYKRRVQLLSIIGSAGTLPSRKFAVSLFANRYSLFATRCRSDAPKFFGSAGGRIS